MDFDKATRTRETCFVIPTPVVILILLNLIMYKLQIVRARFQNFVCLDFLRYFFICITNFTKTTNYTRLTGACNFVIFENLLVLVYSKLHLKSCFIAWHCLALHWVVLICMISFLFFFLWFSPYWFPQSYLRYWTLQKRNIIHLNKTAKQLVRKTSYSVNYPW